jgi:hypothetical protein
MFSEQSCPKPRNSRRRMEMHPRMPKMTYRRFAGMYVLEDQRLIDRLQFAQVQGPKSAVKNCQVSSCYPRKLWHVQNLNVSDCHIPYRCQDGQVQVWKFGGSKVHSPRYQQLPTLTRDSVESPCPVGDYS